MEIREVEDLFQVLDEGVYTVDLERRITFWNKGAERITGFSADSVRGTKCADNILRHVTADGTELCIAGCPLHGTMADGRTREMDVYLHHRNGHRVPVFVRAAPLRNASGQIEGSVEIFSDRTEGSTLRAELELLRHEILTDPLTNLGNRRYLDMAVQSRFAQMQVSGAGFGLLILDIDHFKRVNDTYGHDIGDRVLVMVSSTLRGAIRPLDTAIRYGGEELVAVCPNCDPNELSLIAERIRQLVFHSWLEENEAHGVKVTISIGGAVAHAGDTLRTLIARADERLYTCKESGRNRSLVGD